jgi:hypothetical protein
MIALDHHRNSNLKPNPKQLWYWYYQLHISIAEEYIGAAVKAVVTAVLLVYKRLPTSVNLCQSVIINCST